MSNFTKEKKDAFLLLSKEYNFKVFEIVSKGGPTNISVSSKDEARLFNLFASNVCD